MESITLEPTTKVIKKVRERFDKLFMVTFKYEENVTLEQLEQIAHSRVDAGYQLVVANRGEDMTPGIQKSIIVDERGVIATAAGSKKENARQILNSIEEKLLE